MPSGGGLRLRIRIIGQKEVVRKLTTDYPNRLRQALYETLLEGGSEAAKRAAELAPYKYGHLKRSIRAEANRAALKAFVIAGNSIVNYAMYQEYGTLDSAISPDSVDEIARLLNVGNYPNRRGIMPKLFVHRGVKQMIPRMEQILLTKINRMLAT